MCPNAQICVDRFHLAQAINKAFDEVRRRELKRAQAKRDVFLEGMLAPSRRFVLVEKKKHLTKEPPKAAINSAKDKPVCAVENAWLIRWGFGAFADGEGLAGDLREGDLVFDHRTDLGELSQAI